MTRKTYKGLQENIRGMKLPKIDTWENKYRDKNYVIDVQTYEFTFICPKSYLPDFAHIHIQYIADKACVELKSFKEYLMAYRNLGIFHEHVTNRILDDFIKSCKPKWAKIVTRFNIRGGITTAVTREYSRR
jgi:7-cyano-7-deazaguanine reductase